MAQWLLRCICLMVMFAVAALSIACCAAVEPVADAPSVELGEVISAWQDRQARFPSVQVEWTEDRTDFADAYPGFSEAREDWPSEDTTYSGRCKLLIAGERSLYHYDGLGWVNTVATGKANRLLPRAYTHVFDGTDSKTLNAGDSAGMHPSGTYQKARRNEYLSTPHVMPLSWFYRPLDHAMGGWLSERLEVVDEPAVLDGQSCVVIGVRSPRGKGWQWKLWVDPRQSFVIRRAYHLVRGGFDMQLDIDYQADPHGGLKPAKWRKISLRDGRPRNEMVNTVTRTLTNVDASTDQFELNFPEGTWVVDLRGEKERNYLVRAGGTVRDILRSEAGATYDQIAATETGRAFEAATHRNGASWWIWAGLSLLVASLAGVATKLYRRALG